LAPGVTGWESCPTATEEEAGMLRMDDRQTMTAIFSYVVHRLPVGR
jgi:hypothetical protein